MNYFSYLTSIYKAISADPLHQIELGVFGKHFWLWIISKGDDPGYLGGNQLDALDEKYTTYKLVCSQLTKYSFKRLPPMPGVHHFSNGVVKIKYLTARELGTILRVWIFFSFIMTRTHWR